MLFIFNRVNKTIDGEVLDGKGESAVLYGSQRILPNCPKRILLLLHVIRCIQLFIGNYMNLCTRKSLYILFS